MYASAPASDKNIDKLDIEYETLFFKMRCDVYDMEFYDLEKYK